MNAQRQLSEQRPLPQPDSPPAPSHPTSTALLDRAALRLGLALVVWGRRSRRAGSDRAALARERAERRRARSASCRAEAAARAYRALRLREERERREAEHLYRAYLGGPWR